MSKPGIKTALAWAALVLMASAGARADQTSVNPSPTEPSLASIMTHLYGAGTYARVDDNVDTIWNFISPKASLDAQVRYAGDVSSLGWFNPSDIPGSGTYNRVADITQPNSDPYSAVFSNPSGYGDITGGILTIRGPGSSSPPPLALPGNFAFGFHDSNPLHDNYWTSNMGLNNDLGSNPFAGQINTTDHMVTFFVTNSSGGTVSGFTGYVIAYEDLSHGQSSDRDFNDAVIQINGGVVPSPEPSTMVIAGLAMIGFVGYGVRRRRGA